MVECHKEKRDKEREGEGERAPALLNGECLLWKNYKGYYLGFDIQLSTMLDKKFHHTSTTLLTCEDKRSLVILKVAD